MNTSSEDAHFVWRSLLDSAKHYHKDRWRFLHDCDRDARISILRNACIEPTMEGMALEIIAVLRPEEQLDLLCPLLQLVAESNIYIEPRPDSIVLSLPRELVVGRINECIDLIKKRDEYDSFSPVLYFFIAWIQRSHSSLPTI
jgi:hypothetical protein